MGIRESDVKRYCDKSGDIKISDGTLVENENGFCVWGVTKDSIVLVNVYGNGEYWNKWAEIKGRELGLKKVLFATKRSPKAFCKKYKYKVSGYILERDI